MYHLATVHFITQTDRQSDIVMTIANRTCDTIC